MTYHPLKCDLDTETSHKCKQVYTVEALTSNPIEVIGTVAELTVTYKSECALIASRYSALYEAALAAAPAAALAPAPAATPDAVSSTKWWNYDLYNASKFKGEYWGYEMRQPQTAYNLPTFVGFDILSKTIKNKNKDMYARCGQLTYEFVNPDVEIFDLPPTSPTSLKASDATTSG